MLDIIRIPIARERLQQLTKDERTFLLLLGYTANQITVLWKLIIFSTNRTPDDPVEQRVTGAQTQIFVRQLLMADVLANLGSFILEKKEEADPTSPRRSSRH